MIVAAAFALAAAAGALARAEAGHRWNHHNGFASGTLAVNIVGAFLLGLLHNVGTPAITILGVGGLGAFTTFSSFARDAVSLLETRSMIRFLTYVGLTSFAGIGAAALGVALA